MYEGILSLMQMTKIAAVLTKLKKAKIPYVAVLTNLIIASIRANVTSFGDLIISEPGSLIGLAGPCD
jgi:acetyl-CoA carboxylase carboxyl transferase subunit beta